MRIFNRKKATLFVSLFGLTAIAASMPSYSWEAKVDKVISGDTVKVKNISDEEKRILRLSDIAAPVTGSHGYSSQPYSERSRLFAKELLERADKVDVIDNGVKSGNTTIGRILIDDQDMGKIMVSKGMAWTYPQDDSEHVYVSDQRAARLGNRNIWASGEAIPPWEWRKGGGNNAQEY